MVEEFECVGSFVLFGFLGLFFVERGRGSMMVWFTVKAAMLGRSVNRAARMVRGLDPEVGFADGNCIGDLREDLIKGKQT